MAGHSRLLTSSDRERADARATLTAFLRRPTTVSRGAHDQALDAYRDAFIAEFIDPAGTPVETKPSGLRVAG